MPTEVLTELLKLGILGPIVIAMGWFVLRQQKTIEKQHNEHITATQQHLERLLQLNQAWQAVLTTNSQLLVDTVSALGSVQETIQDVDATLKEVTKQQYALISVLRLER